MTREPEATIELRVGSQILQMLVLRHYWLDRDGDLVWSHCCGREVRANSQF